MRFAICNELFEGWSLDDTFRTARDLGYDGIELAPFTLAPTITDLAPDQRAVIRQAAGNYGLSITGLHWLLARVPGVHLTSPNPALRAVTCAYLLELVRACADLGGSFLVFGSPKQRDVLPGVDRDAAWEWSRETFQAVGRLAADRGVTFCLEPLAPTETNLFRTAAEAARMVDEVGQPTFRLMLDVKAMSSESLAIPEIIAAQCHRFVYFHANDANLREPGSGDVDFASIFQALRTVGYDGWMSIEVFDYKPDPITIARRGLEHLRTVGG
ncbi:MAG: sugar phosphate isomerase/epimerase family protein [Chloroflexota bacterium]